MIEWITSSCTLILVLLFLRYLFKEQLNMRVQYGLWILVLVRLLIPFSISESIFSVMNIVERVEMIQNIERLEGIGEIEYTAQGSVEGYYEKELMPDTPTLIAKEVDEQEFHAMEIIVAARPVLTFIWVCGALIFAWSCIYSNLIFAAKIKHSRRKMTNVVWKLPVYVTDAIESPCLFGVIHPAIYITGEVEEDEIALRHILTHELTHYCHGDHIWSVLRCACLAIHWYNPLVWLTAWMSRRDAELACDEGTVRRLGESERKEYGCTLIRLTAGETGKAHPLVAATTMTGGAKRLKERILFLTRKSKNKIAALVVVCLAVLFAAACTFTGSKESVLYGQSNQDDSIPIFLDLSNEMPNAVTRYAMDYIGKTAENLNRSWERNGFELRAVEGAGNLEFVETGTTAENSRIEMYAVEFRLRLEGDAERYFGGEMKYEEIDGSYWWMGFSNVDVIYLVLSCQEEENQEIWTRLGMINEEDLEWYYNTPEMLAEYGNMYTAVAMELYNTANGISYADLDRDGARERLRGIDTGDGMMYELRVEKLDGSLLWSETAHTAHTGWNSLFLCELNGEDYLLRYNPSMSTGFAAYDYWLFTLENGEENVVQHNSIGFEVHNTHEITPEMEAFAKEINQLLVNSRLLLSTKDGNAVIGPASSYEYMEHYDFLTAE